MSQNQNPFKARIGQAKVVIYQRNNPTLKILPIKFPGGYGKTGAIGLSYNEKRSSGVADRLLIVVATDIPLGQIQNEFATECNQMGFVIKGGVYPCDADHNALARSKHDLAEVYVVSIQRVSSTNRRKDVDMLRALLSDGHKWMIAADEYHHYSTGNDWGTSLQRLVDLAVFTLATSATPDRDKEPTIFGKPLIEVKYKDALEEGAVKRMVLRHYEYRVVTEDIPTGDTVTFTTTELREQVKIFVDKDVDVYLQKRNLRFDSRYLTPVLQGALNSLLRDKLNLNPHAQLLVRALSCNHAKVLCDQINSYGYDLSCDWIGTKSEYNGRPDEENDAVIKRFCPPKDIMTGVRPNPTLDVLVQVNMAGEGFDSIMVSQLADLSLVAMNGAANQTKQFVLRGARWIPGGDRQYQVCQLNVGTDHPIVKDPEINLMDWLDSNEDFTRKPGNPKPPSDPASSDELVDPDWMKGYANLKEVELLKVSQDDPFTAFAFEQMGKEVHDPNWSWDNSKSVEKFTKYHNNYQEAMRQKQHDLNILGREDHLRTKISTLVRKTANEIIVRCSKPRETETFGAHTRLIYNRLRKVCGSPIPEAAPDQLQVAWDYLAQTHNEIVTGTIPLWAK